MTKNFAIGLSIVFILIGVADFFTNFFELYTWQSIFHIVLGGFGLYLSLRYGGASFVKWAGILGVILAGIGFMGVRDIFGMYKLSIPLYWFYLIMALVCIWIYMSERNGRISETNV